MFNQKNEDYSDDVSRVYDSHLLEGDYIELDELPRDDIDALIIEAKELTEKSKKTKGAEKITLQSSALLKYFSAIALLDKCRIIGNEGLLSFMCIQHPELELDFPTLRKITSSEKADFEQQKTFEVALALYISSAKNKINLIMNTQE